MADVTQILSRIDHGDSTAAEQLLPLVYDELRTLAAAKMARERPDQTLQATALVHEAYVRLVDMDQAQHFNSRGHFFAAAAEAMRRILIEKARRKQRVKHGAHLQRRELDDVEITMPGPSVDVLALDEALTKLKEQKPEVAKLVELRYFTGLTVHEAAEAMGISAATADRHWTYARTWLFREMSPD